MTDDSLSESRKKFPELFYTLFAIRKSPADPYFELIGVYSMEEDWRTAIKKAKGSEEFERVVETEVRLPMTSILNRLVSDRMNQLGLEEVSKAFLDVAYKAEQEYSKGKKA